MTMNSQIFHHQFNCLYLKEFFFYFLFGHQGHQLFRHVKEKIPLLQNWTDTLGLHFLFFFFLQFSFLRLIWHSFFSCFFHSVIRFFHSSIFIHSTVEVFFHFEKFSFDFCRFVVVVVNWICFCLSVFFLDHWSSKFSISLFFDCLFSIETFICCCQIDLITCQHRRLNWSFFFFLNCPFLRQTKHQTG